MYMNLQYQGPPTINMYKPQEEYMNLSISFHQAEPTNNAAGGEVSDDDFVPPRSPYCRRFF